MVHFTRKKQHRLSLVDGQGAITVFATQLHLPVTYLEEELSDSFILYTRGVVEFCEMESIEF